MMLTGCNEDTPQTEQNQEIEKLAKQLYDEAFEQKAVTFKVVNADREIRVRYIPDLQQVQISGGAVEAAKSGRLNHSQFVFMIAKASSMTNKEISQDYESDLVSDFYALIFVQELKERGYKVDPVEARELYGPQGLFNHPYKYLQLREMLEHYGYIKKGKA